MSWLDGIRRALLGPRGRSGSRSGPSRDALDRDPELSSDPDPELPLEVELAITDELDLHAFDPRDVKDLVDGYLHEARARGFHEVRVIHGNGKGVQRDIVHAICGEHPAVVGFRLAGGRSGWGATLVTLHPPSAPPTEAEDSVDP
jgi:hypothetical protein